MIATAKHRCKAHEQDEIHGRNIRVFTVRTKHNERICTVCGASEPYRITVPTKKAKKEALPDELQAL